MSCRPNRCLSDSNGILGMGLWTSAGVPKALYKLNKMMPPPFLSKYVHYNATATANVARGVPFHDAHGFVTYVRRVQNKMSHPRRACIQKQVKGAFVSTALRIWLARRLAVGSPSLVYKTLATHCLKTIYSSYIKPARLPSSLLSFCVP